MMDGARKGLLGALAALMSTPEDFSREPSYSKRLTWRTAADGAAKWKRRQASKRARAERKRQRRAL